MCFALMDDDGGLLDESMMMKISDTIVSFLAHSLAHVGTESSAGLVQQCDIAPY
jgi:hypothetical protein